MNETDRLRANIIRNQASKPGLRGKINAMCASCIYDPIGGFGNWRMQVEACTSKDCPLFEVRPKSYKEKKDD